MGTFKRTPFEIDTSVKNGSKYLNQMQFNGIIQNNNTFDVDQNSLTDALNVYVNEQNTLVSREPLVKDSIDVTSPEGSILVDFKETNKVKIYVFEKGTTTTVIAKKNETEVTLVNSDKYNIVVYKQYIICFRTEGAKVIDTNVAEISWKSLSEYSYIPVTKSITGTKEETAEHNLFIPGTYEEQYNINNTVVTPIPNTSGKTVYGNINSSTYSEELAPITNYDVLTNHRILNPLRANISKKYDEFDADYNLIIADRISFAENIVVIGKETHFLISYDTGETFTAVYCPTEANNSFIRTISEDGSSVFYVNETGVFRCNLGDNYSWTVMYVYDDPANKIVKMKQMICLDYHFKNAEVFCFKTRDTNTYFYCNVYFKGPGLWTNDIKYDNKLCTVKLDDWPTYDLPVKNPSEAGHGAGMMYDRAGESIGNCIKIVVDDTGIAHVGLVISKSDVYFAQVYNNVFVVALLGQKTSALKFTYYRISDYLTNWTRTTIGSINTLKFSNTFSDGTTGKVLQFSMTIGLIYYEGDDHNRSGYYFTKQNCEVGIDSSSTSKNILGLSTLLNYTYTNPDDDDLYGLFPMYVAEGIYIHRRELKILQDVSQDTSKNVPFEYIDLFIPTDIGKPENADQRSVKQVMYISNGSYAIMHNGKPYINNLGNKILSIKIKTDNKQEYTDIPTAAYAGEELFLGFGNELKITKNIKDGSNILFSLPKSNDHGFVDTIKTIINISTTELAIFFENGITICSKITDESIGSTYDYAKTRLTLGTKFGDSVINTADGASTLYATPHGLAIMNYQAYMATTDQTLQFISDKIYAIWNKFYLSSENITLVQHGDYVFVYNTSNQYLMLDLRNYSWWKFEIPFNIKKLLTDQIDLRLISDKLYKFKQVNNDTDKIEDDYVDNQYYDADNEPIRWMFMSQRLHFNLPNHYKNMKQLVFHMIQSTGHISTFNAQVKLYRNSVNYKDMEVIPFDFNFAVDEFRTFVKRFNYWKINLLQYGVANDDKAAVPARLVCNGIDVKYEIGDEVR